MNEGGRLRSRLGLMRVRVGSSTAYMSSWVFLGLVSCVCLFIINVPFVLVRFLSSILLFFLLLTNFLAAISLRVLSVEL